MNTINGNYLFDDQLFTSIKYVETSDFQHFRTPKGARQLLTLAPVYNLKVGCTLHKTAYTHPVKAKSNYPISKVPCLRPLVYVYMLNNSLFWKESFKMTSR